MDATRPRPPVLDMTPEGEFRDPPPPPRPTVLDRVLGRVGGLAFLLAAGAGGLVLGALALVFVGLLIPIVLGAGAVAAIVFWWRLRRLRRQGYSGPSRPRFIVVRR